MSTRVVSVLVVAALGFAACGGDVDSPAASNSLPPASSADAVVIDYSEVGGFVPLEFAFQQTPNVLVTGDGRVFSPGAQIAVFPGPLLPAVQVQSITDEGIQAILTVADEAGLLQPVDYDQPTNIADATTARLALTVNGATFVHEAYALGFGAPGEGNQPSTSARQVLADFVAQLNDLPGFVGADQLGEQTIFEPSQFGIEAVVDSAPSSGGDGVEPVVVDWPAAASVRLAGAPTCTVVSATEVGETLASANQLTFFADAGVTYHVLAKPILPGTTCD
jgi:hypothetical protein